MVFVDTGSQLSAAVVLGRLVCGTKSVHWDHLTAELNLLTGSCSRLDRTPWKMASRNEEIKRVVIAILFDSTPYHGGDLPARSPTRQPKRKSEVHPPMPYDTPRSTATHVERRIYLSPERTLAVNKPRVFPCAPPAAAGWEKSRPRARRG